MKSFKDLNRNIVAEAAKGTLHRVRYSHDDSSGNGIASGHLSLHAPDKESASRYAASDLKKRGKKNVTIHSVTPQKSSVKEEVVEEGENKEMKDSDPCWKGYQMVGMKDKGGKKVPNCVPTKEEVEPIEELSKDTLKRYIPTAAADLSKKGISAGIDARSGKAGATKEYGDHFEKRYRGIIKATRKLAKEEVEIDESFSYDLDHKSGRRLGMTDVNKTKKMTVATNAIGGNKEHKVEVSATSKNHALNQAADHFTKKGLKAKVHFDGMRVTNEEVSKTTANMPADIGTPAQLSLRVTPKKLETPVYESRQLEIVREAMADAKKKDAAKKKEQKVSTGGDDKYQSEPELTSSITKNAQ